MPRIRRIMRILICNKFMYPRGGDCNVALATADLLRRHGHEVRLYSMQYPDNLPLPDVSGYASEVSFSGGVGAKISAVKRSLGFDGAMKRGFRKLMREFRPDVVHLHNIHSYLSPVIGEIAAQEQARVVWTLHDYKLICPSYSCRLPDGKNCEECFSGKLRVVKHRCMKGSLAASLAAHLEAARWHRFRLESFCSAFICPSEFMASCMAKAGFAAEKLRVLPNFIGKEMEKTGRKPEGYFCYIGRLSREKGVETLLKAAHTAGVELVVTGDGPLADTLRDRYAADPKIRFTGRLDASGVAEVLAGAKASVMPSECYENNPLGVIESLCAGVPVIGADIAGIPELIRVPSDTETCPDGLLYPSGDAAALARILAAFPSESFSAADIAADALARFSPERHYDDLMRIYTADDRKSTQKHT